MSDLITRKEALFEWIRSRSRMAMLAIGLSAVGIYEAARAWYRPFVYSHGLDDFHVADTLGNSLGTIATVLVFASIFGRFHIRTLFVLRAAAIAVAVYELLHPLLGKPIDPFDLLATVLAGFICQRVYYLVYRRELALERSRGEAWQFITREAAPRLRLIKALDGPRQVMSSDLFSVLPTPWSDDFGYLAWRRSIKVPSEAVDMIKPDTDSFQIRGHAGPSMFLAARFGLLQTTQNGRWRLLGLYRYRCGVTGLTIHQSL